jgi:GTPase SAR1 family protein
MILPIDNHLNMFSKWIDEVQENGQPDMAVLLIGNKTDLKHLRSVSTAEGEAYAQQKSLLFFETSALENAFVEEAFQVLLKRRWSPFFRSRFVN